VVIVHGYRVRLLVRMEKRKMSVMPERVPAIKLVLLPKDTNAYGTIFGGVILSHIDLASAVEARKTAPLRYVTRAMREVEFHEPVFLGDIVSFYTETLRVGRTSITVRVSVEVERWGVAPGHPAGKAHGERVKVTEAEVVLVAVDDRWRAMPIRPDPMQA
jgi:acyl-CoA thioesterase YciA